MSSALTAPLPDLTGRTAIVTGASSGLGLAVARDLAGAGAEVTLAVRSAERGDAAARGILAQHPGARLSVGLVDLAQLASVRAFARSWPADHPDGWDILVNNAGIMAIPRQETVDGFEAQLATNHLGHFALTGLLLDRARPAARVVSVASGAHWFGRLDRDDLMGERRYQPWLAYSQSKLANLLFTSELQRRLTSAGWSVQAVAAHPGYAATNLQSVAPRLRGATWEERVMDVANRVIAQSAEAGALPLLAAAAAPGVSGDDYVGPGGLLVMRGRPRLVRRSAAARDPEAAAWLWDESVRLTGVDYPFGEWTAR
jgi:NAD(P)-dependent dehydrogenase (short-subunit alcohol dehydrogenase family)